MLISNWIQTSSVLTFTIRSTHSHYPICLLNGQNPVNELFAYNGEYQFPLKAGTYYNLVCRNHYDTKDYVVKRSFYVSRSFYMGFALIGLIILFGFFVYWKSWIVELLNPFKANINQEEANSLIKKEETPTERESKHLLSRNSPNEGFSSVVSPSEWRCHSCMYLNPAGNDRCQMCNALNPAVAKKRRDQPNDATLADSSLTKNPVESISDKGVQENEYAESTDEN